MHTYKTVGLECVNLKWQSGTTVTRTAGVVRFCIRNGGQAIGSFWAGTALVRNNSIDILILCFIMSIHGNSVLHWRQYSTIYYINKT